MISPLVRRELQCAIHDGRVRRLRLIVTGSAVGIVALLMLLGLKIGGMFILGALVVIASACFQADPEALQAPSQHPQYNRKTAVLFVIFFVVLVLGALTTSPPSGGALLRVCVAVLFPAVVIEGFRSSLDCLSAERRNGTMSLLLLTRLKGHDIVLGKLAGSSFAGLLQLVAILPIIFFSLFLGGVRGDEFARVSVALAATYALSCCFGVWISSRTSMAHRAAIQAFICFFVVFLMPAALWLSPSLLKTAWLAIHMSVSPGLMLTTSFDAAYRIDPGVWQRAAYSIPLLCVGLLVAAGAHTRQWRSGNVDTPNGKTQSQRKRRDITDRRPLDWLARTQGGGLLAGIRLTVIALTICIGLQWLQTRVGSWQQSTWFPLPPDDWTRHAIEPGVLAAALFIQFSYASRLCRIASSLFQDGSFELLTVAGIKFLEIRRAVRRSLLREFLLPIVIVSLLLIEGVFFNQRMVPEIRESLTDFERLQVVAVAMLSIGVYCASFSPIHHVGLWFSLKRGEAFSATINTWLIINVVVIAVYAAFLYAIDNVAVIMHAFLIPFYACSWANSSIDKHVRKLTGDEAAPENQFGTT